MYIVKKEFDMKIIGLILMIILNLWYVKMKYFIVVIDCVNKRIFYG